MCIRDRKGKLAGLATIQKAEDGSEDIKWTDGKFQDVVEITFPQVVEPDKYKEVEAIAKVIPFGLLDDDQLTKMILIALGESEVEQVMDKMKTEQTPEIEALKEVVKMVLDEYHGKGKK